MVRKFVFIALSVILFAGCKTDELDFDNIKVQPITGTYSFPLGEVTYTMRDLILNQEDSELDFQVDEDSLITLVYLDSIDYQVQDDFINIEDIVNSGTVNLGSANPAAPVTGPGSVTFTDSKVLNYEPTGDEIIDSVFYDQGDVVVDVQSTLPGTLAYSFTIQNTRNVTTDAPLVLNGTQVGPGNSSETSSLVNHKTVLTEAIDNTFVVDIDATLTLGAGETFTGGETLTFDLTFANQTFSIIYGKFQQDTAQVGNSTIDIAFFEEMGEEGIFFGNPTITFFTENSFGIPLGLDFSGIFGDDGMGGNQTFLSGDITENLPVMAYPDNNNPGTTVLDTIQINSGNSSIVDLLATSPARLGFNVSGISNPVDPDGANHLVNGSEFSAVIEIEIPMEVRLENLEQSGTLSLGNGLDIQNVDSVFMRVVTINELPFSGILALEIQDSLSNPLYTVTDNLVLNAPFINVNGFVTDPNGVSADIPIAPAGVEALSTGSHVLLTITLNTPGSLNSRDIFVKVLANYAIEVKVGVGGKVNIDL